MLVRCGDSSQLEHLPILCNTGMGGVFSNVRENLRHGYAKFAERPAKERPIAICGSGPSLSDTLEQIRAMQKRGTFILALNGVGKYLSQQGIKPDALAMVDPRPDNADFVEEAWAPEAWLASQCAPAVVAKAESVGMRVVLWHPGVPGIKAHIPAVDTVRMGGGYTIGLCAMSCAFVEGFRELHLFGFDSSHREEKGHAFRQDRNADDELVDAVIDSRLFTCSTTMAAQASLFLEFSSHLLNDGCELHVHGEGLLPTMWRVEQRKKQTRILQAVYDLGVSPPTFDIVAFLAEAERYRIAHDFDQIDVCIQPGPMHGFRNDNLPPDVETREAMLWRVCVPLARALPSVRNVAALKERAPLAGDVFPEGWKDDAPVSHYGASYMHGAVPMFKASTYSRRRVPNIPYATITLRQSSYWPERNSNIAAWKTAARWLWEQQIWPVLIPDAEADSQDTGWTGEFRPDAALDLDTRLALYECAEMNYGVSNGPTSILPFLDAPYTLFRGFNEACPSTSEAFLASHGVDKTTQFSTHGKDVWLSDSVENVLSELQPLKRKERTS